MFGQNPVSKPVRGNGSKLYVHSLFDTIQGEGPFAGTPAFFIRLSGCNLRCFFCDTDFTSVREEWEVNELSDFVLKSTRAKLVVITGGEPLLQNIGPLVKLLWQNGMRVQIETAGTVWPDEAQIKFFPADFLVCSPKTGRVHPVIEAHCQHWKYIVSDRDLHTQDGLPMHSTQIGENTLKIYRATKGTIWVQPMEEYVDGLSAAIRNSSNLAAAAEIAMRHGYRLSLQLHKIAGLD